MIFLCSCSEVFVLLDLFNMEEIGAYTFMEGDEHTIMDYAVTVYWNNEVDDPIHKVQAQVVRLPQFFVHERRFCAD